MDPGGHAPRRLLVVFTAVFIAALGYYCATNSVDVPIYRDVGAQLLDQDYDIYPAVADGGFRYAPVTALLFVPLALVPVVAGAAGIFLLKIVALVGVVAIILKMLGVSRVHFMKVAAYAFLAVGGYVLEDFRTGNIQFLVFALLILVFFLVDRGLTALPAFLLALAVTLKLTPVLVVLYFGLKRRFHLSAAATAFVVMLFALPTVFLGVEANHTLIEGFVESARQRLDEPRDQSLRGALVRHFDRNHVDYEGYPNVRLADLSTETVTLLWYGLSFCALAGLALVVGSRERDRSGRALEYALVLAAIPLLSPHTLRVYYSVLFFPALIFVCSLIQTPRSDDSRVGRVYLWTAFLISSLIPMVLPGRSIILAYTALSPHFVLGVLGCGTLLYYLHNHDGEASAGAGK